MGCSLEDLILRYGNFPVTGNFVYSVYVWFYSFVAFP